MYIILGLNSQNHCIISKSLKMSYVTEAFLAKLKEYIRIPSISGTPEHLEDCKRCAEFLVKELTSRGFATRKIQMEGGRRAPLVVATRKGQSKENSSKHLLVYGHYDVQPASSHCDWLSDPFDPVIRDCRLYARGAQDNKGQTWSILEGIAESESSYDITVLLDSEEESGSEGLSSLLADPDFVADIAGKDKTFDCILVCDCETYRKDMGMLTLSLRGVAPLEFNLKTSSRILHSGLYGGVAQNAALLMSTFLAEIQNPDGTVNLPGFYDQCRESPQVEMEYREEGVAFLRGIANLPERNYFMPTFEIVGIDSGSSEIRSMIPNEARCRVLCRTVPGQEYDKILYGLEEKLREFTTVHAITYTLTRHPLANGAIRVSPESSYIKAASRALGGEYFGYCGASIPILGGLCRAFACDNLVMVGFGYPEDNMHAANESYSLHQMDMAIKFARKFIKEIEEI